MRPAVGAAGIGALGIYANTRCRRHRCPTDSTPIPRRVSSFLRCIHCIYGPPTGFSDSAWPLLVDCMCDQRRNFFLSANELLLLCELGQQNVAIFGSDGSTAQFMGAVSGHAHSSNVMVSLHVGRGSQIRVRSPFQRLILCTEIAQVMATLNAEKQALQNQLREQSAMILAERDSRQHQDWLEQLVLRERACMRTEDLEVRTAMSLSRS